MCIQNSMSVVINIQTEPIRDDFKMLLCKHHIWWDVSWLWSEKWVYRVYTPQKKRIEVVKTNVEIPAEELTVLESKYPGYRITKQYKSYINQFVF
jgi:hypothetical protein